MEQLPERGVERRPELSETGRPPEGKSAPDLASLERSLGYHFARRGLLEQALTHSSFAHERRSASGLPRVALPRDASRPLPAPLPERPRPPDPPLDPPSPRTDDNEKLEFLGDSILGFVISDMLFRARPDLREGDLSRIKAFIVSAANLVRAAEGIGLGAYLRLGRGEEKTGGREKRALLVDALEALLAAVYLDGGLDPAIRIIADLFDAQVREFAASGDQVSDFKSVLQERLQAEGRPPARYQLVEESGPSHERFFTVAVLIDNDSAGTGQGPNKKAAEQCAAMDALTRYPAFQR